MSKLHSVLVVFGAIDDIVDGSQDARILQVAQEWLPNAGGLGQSGWYAEIKSMAKVLTPAGEDAVTFPTLQDAVGSLLGAQAGVPADNDTLSRHDLDRLSYAANVLIELKKAGARVDVADSDLEALRDLSQTPRRPCEGVLRNVNGQFCTVITTRQDDVDVSVDDIKKVLDPLNWPKYCSFFKSMKDLGRDSNRWTRVLEEVGTDFSLGTTLKFWKGELEDGSIFVNYDLDDHRSTADGDDGWVLVDNGYIMVARTADNHVDIFTSKEIAIPGLSPTATAVLACQLGWAEVGDHLFDAAERLAKSAKGAKQPAGTKRWKPSDTESPGKPAAPTGALAARIPRGMRGALIAAALEQADDFFTSTSAVAGDFATRWQNGIDRKDVADVAAKFSKELAHYSMELFDAPKKMFMSSMQKVDAGQENGNE
ncbi:MAG: hypothetical protein QOC62_2988 [Mycobacterium sp.]|jgi:hypothetical protein|nr:hypothetical protein [Mycobacterium sp.]